MKKIMFNDRFHLTEDVLSGSKEQTRRMTPAYEVGDVVAIAQSYRDICVPRRGYGLLGDCENCSYRNRCTLPHGAIHLAGWNNKMFVAGVYMPLAIRIIAKRREHLQDISERDCLKEGVILDRSSEKSFPFWLRERNTWQPFHTAQDAYAYLLRKISSDKGIWERNPLVYVYDFELIK